MIIKTVQTPNPNSFKFIVQKVWINFVWECFCESDAKKSELSNELWKLDGVCYLLFGNDFVSITKKPDYEWCDLESEIIEIIGQFLEKNIGLFEANVKTEKVDSKNYSEIEKKIAQKIEEKIQPALANHGGMVFLKKFEDGVVYLELQGACKGCPSSEVTIKYGISNLLKYYFEEVKEIVSI